MICFLHGAKLNNLSIDLSYDISPLLMEQWVSWGAGRLDVVSHAMGMATQVGASHGHWHQMHSLGQDVKKYTAG